jgi:signal transduction histidine kinase
MEAGEKLNAEESEALLAKVASLFAQTTVFQGILHDVKNGVMSISSDIAALIREQPCQDSPRIMKRLKVIEETSCNLGLLVSHGRELGRWLSGDQEKVETVDISEVMKEAIRLVRPLKAKIMLRGQASFVLCEIPRSLILESFINILRNSLDANSSSVDIKISNERSKGEEEIVVRLEDDGTGISDDILDRVFDPYFTTKTSNPGLGLTVARQCLLQYGGHLSLQSKGDRGTTVVLRLPLKKPQMRVGKAGRG